MKKFVLSIALLFVCSISAMSYEQYLKAKYDVEQLRTRAGVARGAYWGSRIGSGVGLSSGAVGAALLTGGKEPMAIPVGAAIGGVSGVLIGAGTGAAIAASMSGFVRWKINKVLQAYTPYTFSSLPIDAAIIVLAAYKKKVDQMKQLASQVQSFLNEPGVWQALTHLYFGQEPTPELVSRLQQMMGATS